MLPLLALLAAPEAAEARSAIAASGDGLEVCAEANGEVRFVGASDTLMACLERYPQPGRTWTITSPGGEVGASRKAARRLGELKLHVRILGLCASSCGNYVVPAARSVEVLPWSMILLHGSALGDMTIERADIAQAVRQAAHDAGQPEPAPEVVARTVDRAVADAKIYAETEAAGDRAFMETFKVRRDWLQPYKTRTPLVPVGTSDGGPMRWADRDYARAALPGVTFNAYWQPDTPEEVEAMAAMVSKHHGLLVARRFLQTLGYCRTRSCKPEGE